MNIRVLFALFLAILVVGAVPGGTTASSTLGLRVLGDAIDERVVLQPYDPRAPALAAEAPALADGLWTGRLADGGLVRLVELDGSSIALVETGEGLAWFTRAGGSLVPFRVPMPEPVEIDTQLRAPQGLVAPPVLASGRDGKLQLMMDADRTFTAAWNVVPDGAARGQLAIISLVDVIYRVNLGVEIEVVEQVQRTTTGNYTDPIRCGAFDDLLAQFRDAWESTRPTTSDVRESGVIFTSKTPVAHPSGGTLIGCGYIAQLETSYAYASVRIPVPTNFALQALQDVPLVAHEIGHNFGGLHERALPTPGGELDILTCTGASVMYPYLCQNGPYFSDTSALGGLDGLVALAEDGGNARWMEEYAGDRI